MHLPGQLTAVPLNGGAEGVAVVADGYWQATQGRDALEGRKHRLLKRSTPISNSPFTANWPIVPVRASSTPTWGR